MLKIFIIILNWNGKEDTLECLASLKHINYPNFNIIVTDNGSTDDSVIAIRTAYPDIFILENGNNLGFAEGNNRAIRFALQQETDAILILNNDTLVDSNLLQAFYDAYASLPDAGILGAVSYYYDKPEIIWAAGGLWDTSILGLRHIALGQTEADLPSQRPYEIEYAVGCALFVHKDVIAKIGLMDPLFFLNFEETDWCQRAQKAGFKNYTVPDAKIWHKVSVSFGGESPLWRYFMTRNQLLWAKRYLPAKEYRSVVRKAFMDFFPDMTISYLGRPLSLKQRYWALMVWIKQAMSRCSNPFYIARYFGIYHYFINRFGDCPQKLRRRLIQTANLSD
jgi:GT2 family glycosyltransferase